MKVNLNWMCRFRENARGMEALNDHYRGLGLSPDQFRAQCRLPDGRLEMELWRMARIYGETFIMGPPASIDKMEIEIVEE